MQPTHIGRYEVVRVLGQGAMGVVFEAIDPRLARRVAIKTIRVESLDSHQAMAYEARFETEARAVARLAHPNIVSVYDSGQMDGQSYLVLEFVAGVNLKQCLRAGVRFTPQGAVAVMQGVLAGLAQAHGQRIIHRDIKPENVLLDAAGQVKLTDFGIAKMLDAEVDNGTQLSGGSIGTPRYMSPEQVRGLPLDARSDVFSAAVLLYELLTGTVPFDGGSAIAIATAILHDDPPKASDVAPGIPPELDAVLTQALSKTVHLRPESAQALLDAISAVPFPGAEAAPAAPNAEAIATDSPLPPGWVGMLTPDGPARVALLFGEVGLELAAQAPSSGLPLGTQPSSATGAQTLPLAPRVDDVTVPSVLPPAPSKSMPGAAEHHPGAHSRVLLYAAVAVLLGVAVWWWGVRSPVSPPVVVNAPALNGVVADPAQSLADNEKLVPQAASQSVSKSAEPASGASTPPGAEAGAASLPGVKAPEASRVKPRATGSAAEKPQQQQPQVSPPVTVPPAPSKPVETPQAKAAAPTTPATPGAAAPADPCPDMGFFEREACLWKQCSTPAFREHAACARFQNKPSSSP